MILDTSALSAWAEEDASFLRFLPPAASVDLPVIVVGEYRFGIRRSRARSRLDPWLDGLVREHRVLDVNLESAEIYATLRERLRELGRPIPDNDLWIAALAVQHEAPILSRDSHFDAVAGVTRIEW